MPIAVLVLKLVVALLTGGLAWYALARGYNLRFNLLWLVRFDAERPRRHG